MNFFVGTYKEYDAINAEEVSVIIPKVIETEKEYENALARINDLMDADPGTPEGDELEMLVTLVEAYEKVKYPIDPPDLEIDRIGKTRGTLIKTIKAYIYFY